MHSAAVRDMSILPWSLAAKSVPTGGSHQLLHMLLQPSGWLGSTCFGLPSGLAIDPQSAWFGSWRLEALKQITWCSIISRDIYQADSPNYICWYFHLSMTTTRVRNWWTCGLVNCELFEWSRGWVMHKDSGWRNIVVNLVNWCSTYDGGLIDDELWWMLNWWLFDGELMVYDG